MSPTKITNPKSRITNNNQQPTNKFTIFNFTILNHLAYSAKAALATKARQ